ncbi:MAG: hypothetical protein O3A87_08400 [Verrucomicrobia bacterium]|nr:hypothetical protein [Verrucomicrobiota bacterium]MDA1006483.1 hypothetical protein [Verrucomicrobiota bacterium]
MIVYLETKASFQDDILSNRIEEKVHEALRGAAGDFSPAQWLTDCQWAELPEGFAAKEGYFIAQVLGESMNRRIPNHSWCLFRPPRSRLPPRQNRPRPIPRPPRPRHRPLHHQTLLE